MCKIYNINYLSEESFNIDVYQYSYSSSIDVRTIIKAITTHLLNHGRYPRSVEIHNYNKYPVASIHIEDSLKECTFLVSGNITEGSEYSFTFFITILGENLFIMDGRKTFLVNNGIRVTKLN